MEFLFLDKFLSSKPQEAMFVNSWSLAIFDGARQRAILDRSISLDGAT
jgi:hypothetical protein